MKRRKVLALLMAMTMAVSTTVACGGAKTDTAPTAMVDVTRESSSNYAYEPSPAPSVKGAVNTAPEAEYYVTDAECGADYYLEVEPYYERETYNVLEEKGFSDVSLSPLSTFNLHP